MRTLLSHEKIDSILLFGSTLCCAIVVTPIFNVTWFLVDPIEQELAADESRFLSKLSILISIICYSLVFFIFSRTKFSFIVISLIGFVFSLFGLLTTTQLFTRFLKPWNNPNFWPLLGISLIAGTIVSFGLMSVLSLFRWLLIGYLTKQIRLP